MEKEGGDEKEGRWGRKEGMRRKEDGEKGGDEKEGRWEGRRE